MACADLVSEVPFGNSVIGFAVVHLFRHSFVIVSSRFKIARLTIAHAATLCRFTSGGTFLMSGTATASAAALRSSKYLYCSSQKRRIDLSSRSVGARPVQSRKA